MLIQQGFQRGCVALLAEGVDRNLVPPRNPQRLYVALLAEGVDRNTLETSRKSTATRSPSSRRAWIEICQCGPHSSSPVSPSSRRAWIEIASKPYWAEMMVVALLAEGVDRNR